MKRGETKSQVIDVPCLVDAQVFVRVSNPVQMERPHKAWVTTKAAKQTPVELLSI